MPNLTITAANVAAQAGAVLADTTAGATITAGQVIYQDATDNDRAKLADNDGTPNPAARIPVGIALHGASAGQPLKVLRSGQIVIGATLTAGRDYYLSATAGSIYERADLGAGNRIVSIGFAISATVLQVNIFDTGVTP
jgi:hypothetical protein